MSKKTNLAVELFARAVDADARGDGLEAERLFILAAQGAGRSYMLDHTTVDDVIGKLIDDDARAYLLSREPDDGDDSGRQPAA